MKSLLTAKEAAERLGIRKETLYAYVSRGLIDSVESRDGRSRLYRLADIETLETRREQRRRPSRVLSEALSFGGPILESSLTLIEGGQIFYRGRSMVELARTTTFERVAAWLWLGDADAAERLFQEPPGLPATVVQVLKAQKSPWTVEAMQSVITLLGEAEPRCWRLDRPGQLAAAGARLLQQLVLITGLRHRPTPSPQEASTSKAPASPAEAMADVWCQGSPMARRLLDTAFIVCADHELNVSSFTARCVASADSPLYSAIAAGLGALHGARHGGHSRRIEALLREAGDPEHVEDVLLDRQRRGEPIPGFGQPLYPDGDPRFHELTRRIGELYPDAPARRWADAFERAGRDIIGRHPTVDVGLALTAQTLGLPRDAALTLFAIGRTAGWIGHALEQYADQKLIRPRAKYVGPTPEQPGLP